MRMESAVAAGIGAILTACVAGQSVHTIGSGVLPAGFPTSVAAPAFTSGTALAVCEDSTIHVVTGLHDPLQAAGTSIALSGALAKATPWHRLGPQEAVYSSAAAELILVRDLPGNPALVPTGIADPDPAFVPVNTTTAARLDAAGGQLVILRHGPAGATRHVVPSPVPLASGPPWPLTDFRGGPSGGNRYLAVGGVGNRTIVIFTGLLGPPPGFSVTTLSLGPGTPLSGLFTTPAGTGVASEFPSSATTRLTFIRFPTASPLTTTLDLASPEAGANMPATPGAGDNVIAGWDDFLAGHFRLVIDADGPVAVAVHSWCSWALGCVLAMSLREDEMLEQVAGTVSFTHRVFTGPWAGSTPVQIPASPFKVLQGNADTLVALSNAPVNGQWWLTVVTALHGSANSVTLPVASTVVPTLLPLSQGRSAILATTSPGNPSLSVVALPTAFAAGASNALVAGLALSAPFGPPRVGWPFEVRVISSDPALPPMLAAAGAIAPPGALPGLLLPGSLLDLEPAAFLGLFPMMSIGTGLWRIDLGLQSAPPDLAGTEFYLQAVQPASGGLRLSNTLLIIPG